LIAIRLLCKEKIEKDGITYSFALLNYFVMRLKSCSNILFICNNISSNSSVRIQESNLLTIRETSNHQNHFLLLHFHGNKAYLHFKVYSTVSYDNKKQSNDHTVVLLNKRNGIYREVLRKKHKAISCG